MAARGVAPAPAPPRFPHLAPPPHFVPQPSGRAAELGSPVPDLCRAGGEVGLFSGSSIPAVWDLAEGVSTLGEAKDPP